MLFKSFGELSSHLSYIHMLWYRLRFDLLSFGILLMLFSVVQVMLISVLLNTLVTQGVSGTAHNFKFSFVLFCDSCP
jgi:hypothetical protein